MSYLRFGSANLRRFGLGIAIAALALTSFASPMPVAASENAGGTVAMAHAESLNALVPQKSDIQVTARGKQQKGTTTYYYFTIKNLGPAPASNIHAYKEAHVHALIGNGSNLVGQNSWTLNLASGQSVPVTVTCTPQTGYYCHHATTLVWMDNTNDPNGSNDVATIY